MVQRWVRENACSYGWATQGRSAKGAAWHDAILDEAATSEGLQSATAFLDLTNAFEMVRLQDVWMVGCRYHFLLALLRLMLEAFAFGRHLTYQGAVSDATHTLSAILVDAGFAQVALLLVLMGPLDAIQGR